MVGKRAGHEDDVRALDIELGGDDDLPGIALELTVDDVDDIALSPGIPLEDRRARLRELRDDLKGRQSSDMMGDSEDMLAYVEGRIADLDTPADSDGMLESIAMDADSRSDDDDPADHIDDEEDDDTASDDDDRKP
ncbi:MAG: hypothetical protein SGJ21_08550 [Alphaproteobacteria bacterium]|nr:hypothetical protein [Alphaproteobacteria bacterium]